MKRTIGITGIIAAVAVFASLLAGCTDDESWNNGEWPVLGTQSQGIGLTSPGAPRHDVNVAGFLGGSLTVGFVASGDETVKVYSALVLSGELPALNTPGGSGFTPYELVVQYLEKRMESVPIPEINLRLSNCPNATEEVVNWREVKNAIIPNIGDDILKIVFMRKEFWGTHVDLIVHAGTCSALQ